LLTPPRKYSTAKDSTADDSEAAGSLKRLRGDWEKGKLEFDVVESSGEVMPVLIRLKATSGLKGALAIESFEAKGVDRDITRGGRLTSYEW
jgi:hypothetical protein